jgi:glucose/arabinose dehydrogenase
MAVAALVAGCGGGSGNGAIDDGGGVDSGGGADSGGGTGGGGTGGGGSVGGGTGSGGGGGAVADQAAPIAALSAPAPFSDGLTGMLAIAASASDDVGVAAVEFQVDGETVGEDTTAPYAATVDTALHAAGQHVLRARARDSAGNRSAWASATVRFGGSSTVGAGFAKDDAWVGGLRQATAFAQASDGRFFVAEQGGALRVVKDGRLLPTPFVQLPVDSAGERGLIGIALHPQFPSNGWVYVHHTTHEDGTHNRVTRLVAAGDVSDGSRATIVDLPPLSSATNHNGGAIHFGADGKLYVAVGENARGSRAQDLSDPFGKLLRLNDDGSVPGDNPFFSSQSGLARGVWAYGLRNPFTFAIQPETGRIHINDVGAHTWEEINLGIAGANYGWPMSEGPDGVNAGITGPLFTYQQTDSSPPGSGPGGFFTGFAIAGGAFYPDNGNFPPSYRGNYFFADFGTGFVARLDLANDNAAYAFAQLNAAPVDMLVGNDGTLYVLTRDAIARIGVH